MLTAIILVTAALCIAVAGAAKAAVDILTHQAGNNIFEARGPWYDARTSWKLKYKDYDAGDLRPRFFKSTTWLVMFTDFWHAADSVYLQLYAGGFFLLGIALAQASCHWLLELAAFVLARIVFGLVFELLYTKVFRKQPVNNKQ